MLKFNIGDLIQLTNQEWAEYGLFNVLGLILDAYIEGGEAQYCIAMQSMGGLMHMEGNFRATVLYRAKNEI